MAVSLKESVLASGRLPRSDDVVESRAALLSPVDRDLVEAVLVRGQTTRSLARLMGMSPRGVRDRVNRLTKRMASRAFIDAARSLPYLSPEDAALATLRFCQGYRLRGLCEKLGVSEHTVRRRLVRVEAEIQAINRMTQRSARQVARAYREFWDGHAESDGVNV
jgi:DNA-directed RNA polymerase specialized sigma24 family protein